MKKRKLRRRVTGRKHFGREYFIKQFIIDSFIYSKEEIPMVVKVTSDTFENEVLKSELPVLLDCYADWCGPCKMMANNEFPKKEAGDYFNAKFVNAKFDMEKGEGPDIARKYQVTAYPTFLVLNEHGEMVHRVVGNRIFRLRKFLFGVE